MSSPPIDFGFGPPAPTDEQATMRETLAFVMPKNTDDVRMVAAALKTHGPKFEDLFVEWAAPFGRYKAKGLWAKARPDPDALTEVFERQLAASTKRDRFRPLTAAELDRTPQPYRIKSVLPETGLVVLYGPSGSGKSFVSFAMAGAIGEGRPFFGYPTRIGPVLYVGLEGMAGVHGRIAAWERHYGRPMPDNVRFLLQPFRLTESQDVSDLAANCAPGCVVIIDTLNRAAPNMDENSSKDMGVAIEAAMTLQRLIAGLVVLIAHSGKDATKGIRGHSSLFAASDGVILVSRDGEHRRWKVDKAKDGQDGTEHGFRLKVVDLGTDGDGDPISSCVIESDHLNDGTRQTKPLTSNQKQGLSSYHEAAGEVGRLTTSGAFAGLHVDDWRRAFYRICTADSDEAKRKAFQRARGDLVERGELTVSDDLYRLGGPNAAVTENLFAQSLKAKQDSGTGQGHLMDMSRVVPPP